VRDVAVQEVTVQENYAISVMWSERRSDGPPAFRNNNLTKKEGNN